MVKPRSQQSGKAKINPKLADTLADQLADKPYGKMSNEEESVERLTISMNTSLYNELELLARKRKRSRADNRSMSAIAREAIREYLKGHDS